MTGIELIAKERQEQIEKHGRTIENDVLQNDEFQLSFAASLLNAPSPKRFARQENNFGCPKGWNIDLWVRMLNKPYKERLIIAGALIAAEIDRLQSINN